ncbi:MAG: NAD(P)/FAD-dependent oxidoreductase [Ferruginibacter sp.]|nr:NAD(P)/FAD-dependent oxidoreductase [Ferruginibacter sp.]
MNNKTLIVIGGGAAGFFCAVNAAMQKPLLKVIILEKTGKLLSKVKISGGGRCNVTHACFTNSELVKKYPRGDKFLKKTFEQFTTTDTIEWFKKRGVELKAEDDGRMFPVTNSSQTIIDCLIKEANKFGVEVIMNADVKTITKTNDSFLLQLANEKKFEANYLCMATGGYPKDIQFSWMLTTGHSIANPVPSLFTFNLVDDTIKALMGVVVEDALVKIAQTKLQQQGPVLITHWGLSGPAILKLSAWAARELALSNWQFTIVVNWLPQYNENTLLQKFQLLRFELAAQKMTNKNPFGLPNRFWEYLLNTAGIKSDCRWADLPAKEQNKLVKNICTHEYAVKGKTTFKEEFVTAGGIQLNEINANTMESKIVPNLFFAGEVINVDGITGGFNFQNAWTTGWIAAKEIGGRGI